MSDVVIAAPQGTELSPEVQYDLESVHLQKLSDDSFVGCIRDGHEDRALVDWFVEWAKLNHLLVNVDKTREMVADFRRGGASL